MKPNLKADSCCLVRQIIPPGTFRGALQAVFEDLSIGKPLPLHFI